MSLPYDLEILPLGYLPKINKVIGPHKDMCRNFIAGCALLQSHSILYRRTVAFRLYLSLSDSVLSVNAEAE
jgi:hypothetical protein